MTPANLLLVAFMFVSQGASAAYSYLRLETPPAFDLLVFVGTLYALGHWLEVDNRKYNFRSPYCRGIILYVAAFVVVPYYLFKTRGKYAFLTLFIFLCLTILTNFTGMRAAALLIGSPYD
jgi:hypothetical protein